MKTQEYFNEFFDKGQLLSKYNFMEIEIPKNDKVYTLKEIMEELDFSGLLSQYSKQGRRSYNPIMMFGVLLYANMQGIRSVDKIIERCKRDICYMYLTGGVTPGRDAFYNFKNKKLNKEVLEDLHCQFMKKLKEKGLLTLESIFIDGTKIEANANKYTFVWRGSVNYHLTNLLYKFEKFISQYNEMINERGYIYKYGLLEEEMFVIEGTEELKKVIKENREKKKQGKDKKPNNKIIEINNIGPDFVLRIKEILKNIAQNEKIEFVNRKGLKKSNIQKMYEHIDEYGNKLLKYKEHFKIMGENRNSYSKTDKEATFMRMKDDHMMNGQLKAGYNLQFGVENYFITSLSVSDDRSDYYTLIPLLSKQQIMTGIDLTEVTADSGYCSEGNFKYLKENNITNYIKLNEHEQKKKRKYKEAIGKHYNMKRIIDDKTSEYTYICHDGRKLEFVSKGNRKRNDGTKSEYKQYICENCSKCTLKKRCLYNYSIENDKDDSKNKSMKIFHEWEALKEEAYKNIQSEKGIYNRHVRSIQTEGAFGDMKENDDFRKFNYRGTEKVYKEVFLYAFGRNINKYHRFKHQKIKAYTM